METTAMEILKTLPLHAILFWMNKPPRKKSMEEVINHLSWIRIWECQKQLCKGLNSETFSSKIELKKTETIMLNRETYVLHFWEKVKDNFMVILNRKNYVIIRSFGV